METSGLIHFRIPAGKLIGVTAISRASFRDDTELGILTGSPHRLGAAVVSGTRCNCQGWDSARTCVGRVKGGGIEFGEYAGASKLIFKKKHTFARAWTKAGPPTALTNAFCQDTVIKEMVEANPPKGIKLDSY